MRICRRCGKPEDGHLYRHPFDADGTGPNPFDKRRQKPQEGVQPAISGSPVQSAMPFDPVLRQALISKGVITPADLAEAETVIRTVTGMVLSGLPQDLQGGPNVPRAE